MSTGLFITIDGPCGVGKTTATAATADLLAAVGHTVYPTGEPSDLPIGRFTRQMAEQVHGRALACLVAADRHEHLRAQILPQLELGHTVVCDRYLASSLVLQRIDGVPADYIQAVNAGVKTPDLAVILNATPAAIADRLARRGTHHRFHQDPLEEILLYGHLEQTLTEMGVPVLLLHTASLTPSEIAARIAAAAEINISKVTPHE